MSFFLRRKRRSSATWLRVRGIRAISEREAAEGCDGDEEGDDDGDDDDEGEEEGGDGGSGEGRERGCRGPGRDIQHMKRGGDDDDDDDDADNGGGGAGAGSRTSDDCEEEEEEELEARLAMAEAIESEDIQYRKAQQ